MCGSTWLLHIQFSQDCSFVMVAMLIWLFTHCEKYQALSTRIRIFLNPQLFLSGYGFRPHASGKFSSESGYFLICSPEWTVNPGIFESDDVAKSCPVSYQTINQFRIRYVWTGKFLNPEIKSCGFKDIWIRVDGASKSLSAKFCFYVLNKMYTHLLCICLVNYRLRVKRLRHFLIF